MPGIMFPSASFCLPVAVQEWHCSRVAAGQSDSQGDIEVLSCKCPRQAPRCQTPAKLARWQLHVKCALCRSLPGLFLELNVVEVRIEGRADA